MTPFFRSDMIMPVLFVGHGSPINAIQRNAFSEAWSKAGEDLPRPSAVLCISAHWETADSRLTAMLNPQTLYDFHGFPPELYQVQYPAPGSPELARHIRQSIPEARFQLDHNWGLDHGAWSVLKHLFPTGDVPVVQLSLDIKASIERHYQLGQMLKPLRRQGVLVIGSGNIVHNLRTMRPSVQPYDWAVTFDRTATERINDFDHRSLIHYETLGEYAQLAVPTREHFLPLLYVLAMQEVGEKLHFFANQITMGSISMRSLRIG
jgi:4,5-DOPA dioxygenase extradiol